MHAGIAIRKRRPRTILRQLSNAGVLTPQARHSDFKAVLGRHYTIVTASQRADSSAANSASQHSDAIGRPEPRTRGSATHLRAGDSAHARFHWEHLPRFREPAGQSTNVFRAALAAFQKDQSFEEMLPTTRFHERLRLS